MPAIALPAVLAGASSIIAGQTLVVFGMSLGVIGTGIFVAATSAALGFLAQQLAPEPSFPDLRPFRSRESQRIQQISQAITSWQLVYGFKRVSGPLIYATTTNSLNKLHLIIILAAHEIEAIDTVLINAEPIYPSDIDGSGDVVSGKYANNVKIKKHLGSPTQTADADLVAATDEWTTNHRARGRAYLYIELTKNSKLFKSSVPGISAWVKGKKVKEIRDSAQPLQFTQNMALIIRDYITLARNQGGMGFTEANLDDTTFESAANTCDEMVATEALALDLSSVSVADDEFLVAEDSSLPDILQFQLGDRVQVASTGTLPTGLSAATNYYVIVSKLIRTDDTDPGFKLAASLDDAMAGTAISISGAGSGTITVTRNAEPRYHGAGVVETSRNPEDVLDEMRLGCAARLAHVGDKWKIFDGKYVAPTITIDESDLRDNMVVSTRHASRERFNSVKGLYSAQVNNGVATSYPSVTNATYVSDDGGITYWKDIDLSWIQRPHTAERIAKIELERHRREISLQWPGTLALFQLHAGLNVMVDNDRLGWSAKVFECAEVSFGQVPDEFRNPTLVTDLYLRETDAAVYTWASSEEGAELASPRTNLPGAFDITVPTGITITSGTSQLYLKKDGTVVSRIKVAWTDPASAFLDYVETQVKRTADVNWEPAIRASAGVEQSFIWDVEDGDSYDIRLRAVGDPPVAPKSDWTATETHVVVGKTAPPEDVTGFSAQQNGSVVTFRWNQIPDLDRAGYELRYAPQGTFIWEAASGITRETKGTLVTNAGLPPGSWTVGVKAVDTSGNFSETAATFDIDVVNQNEVVSSRAFGPHWKDVRLPAIYRYPVKDHYAAWGTLPSGVTYAQPTIDFDGSYVDADGVLQYAAGPDEPRFTYEFDGAAWALAGLLNEPERTNLLPLTEEWGVPTSPWGQFAGGGTTVAAVLGNGLPGFTVSATSNREFYSAGLGVLDGQYTLSVFGEIWSGALSRPVAYVNPHEPIRTAQFVNGRAAVPFTRSAASSELRIGVGTDTNDSGTITMGGPQIEAAADASSYIRNTTTGTATRAASVSTITETPEGLPLPDGTYDVVIARYGEDDELIEDVVVSGGTYVVPTSVAPLDEVYLISYAPGTTDAEKAALLAAMPRSVEEARPILTGFVRHDVSGSLVPASQDVDSTADDIFDLPVPRPVEACRYSSPETDVGHQSSGLRVWATYQAEPAPGETDAPDITVSLDYRAEAGSYDGHEPWTIGTVDARYLKWQLDLVPDEAVTVLRDFDAVVDQVERQEIHTAFVVAPGGTTLTYDERFFGLPNIGVAAQAVAGAGRYAVWQDKTETSVDLFVFDAGGSDVGGTVDVIVTGA